MSDSNSFQFELKGAMNDFEQSLREVERLGGNIDQAISGFNHLIRLFENIDQRLIELEQRQP